ncbi:NYN domain-containing protein [Nitrospinota bacterium]
MTDLNDGIALYIDFENLARGFTRSSRDEFDIHRVLARLVEKGKVVMKRAYCDWSRFIKFKDALHEAGIELVEVPRRSVTGKNSADIRMVVDAMDMCYAKEHIGTFVIASGDSDFSPLVSKLKENGKHVIGLGMKGSTSNLLAENCDEFIFYEDLETGESGRPEVGDDVPKEKKEAFDLLFDTVDALQRENVAIIWSSIVKETMKRKRPSFSETAHGYRSFSRLLEDAKRRGYIQLRRDERSGSYIIVDFGRQDSNGDEPEKKTPAPKRSRRSSATKGASRAKTAAGPEREPAQKQKKATAKRSTIGGMKRPQKKRVTSEKAEEAAETGH